MDSEERARTGLKDPAGWGFESLRARSALVLDVRRRDVRAGPTHGPDVHSSGTDCDRDAALGQVPILSPTYKSHEMPT